MSANVAITESTSSRLPSERFGYGLSPFALDLRAVALFRIVLAGLVAALFTQWSARFITASPESGPLTWTLAAEAAALGMVAVGSLGLLIGWASRPTALVTLLAILVVHAFNPATIGPAALLIRLLLLWATLLPLGERYAADSALEGPTSPGDRVASVATAGVLLQLLVLYLAPGVLADPGPLRSVTPLARAVEAQPYWPAGVTLVEAVEALGFGMLILGFAFTGTVRAVAALAMPVLHGVAAFALDLGLLHVALGAMWLLLIPLPVWDALERWVWTEERRRVRLWHSDRDATQTARVRLLRTFLLLPPDTARPTSEDVDMDVFRRQRDSWVVTDASGYRYVRFRAVAAAFAASPLFWPAGLVMRIGFIESIGDWFYDLTRRRQGPVVMLVERVGTPRTTVWHQFAAALLLAVLLLWQLWLAQRLPLPGWEPMHKTLRLVLGG